MSKESQDRPKLVSSIIQLISASDAAFFVAARLERTSQRKQPRESREWQLRMQRLISAINQQRTLSIRGTTSGDKEERRAKTRLESRRQKSQTHLSVEGVRHRERGHYPAVSVDNVRGQALDDAGDGIPHVLSSRDHQRARKQQHCGEVVVQSEHHGFGADLLPLQVTAQITQQLIHDRVGV